MQKSKKFIIEDKQGNNMYPATFADVVYTEDGGNVAEKLSGIADKIDENISGFNDKINVLSDKVNTVSNKYYSNVFNTQKNILHRIRDYSVGIKLLDGVPFLNNISYGAIVIKGVDDIDRLLTDFIGDKSFYGYKIIIFRRLQNGNIEYVDDYGDIGNSFDVGIDFGTFTTTEKKGLYTTRVSWVVCDLAHIYNLKDLRGMFATTDKTEILLVNGWINNYITSVYSVSGNVVTVNIRVSGGTPSTVICSLPLPYDRVNTNIYPILDITGEIIGNIELRSDGSVFCTRCNNTTDCVINFSYVSR